jgi:predicted metalloprotease with PDZ domain
MGPRAGNGSAPDIGASPAPPSGPAWDRLEGQLGWYGGKAAEARKWYLGLKVLQIVVAAAITVVAAGGASRTVAAALGATVVVVEGIQQLFQFHGNWIRYRTAAEALKRERTLFLERAGPYADAGGERPEAMLAEVVENIVSKEGAAWAGGSEPRRQKEGT